MPDKPPSLRERQAQLTQAEILKAARRLFAERGYTRTSVRDIAEAAAVSTQTVYDSIGSKQALVLRLNDIIHALLTGASAITDFQFAILLRDSYGWSLDHIESWAADASRALLLRSA